jgi:hypothetical protein
MRRRNFVKYALVVIQVGILASAFFFFFGWVAMVLYILGEISVAEIVDYLLIMSSMEGFSFIVFLEGLAWMALKKNRRKK